MSFEAFLVRMGVWATAFMGIVGATLFLKACHSFGRWLRWKRENACTRCGSLRTRVSGFASHEWGGVREYLQVVRKCRACGHHESREGKWSNGRWVEGTWIPVGKAA